MKALHTQWVMNTRPALEGSKDVSTGVALRQCVEQRLDLLQVSRVKPLSEPAVDRRKQLAGFGALALLLPEPAQAQRRPQLQRLRLLAAGNSEGLVKAPFGLEFVSDSLFQ